MNYTYGIDLGTTFTCVEWISHGTNKSPEKPFPSAVRIIDKYNETYGLAATSATVKNGCYPFIDSKRFIGKRYKDCDFNDSNYAFDIVNMSEYPYYVKVYEGGKKDYYSPKDISSKILKFIYNNYSQYVDHNPDFHVKDVVITVPAKFSTSQRIETRKAGEEAGFNVLRLINEPTAAALAYIYDKACFKDLDGKTILIYDFGGGTFDVAIIKVCGKDIYVKATGGDDHLGGQDITNKIMNYVLEEYKKKIGNCYGMLIDEKTIFRLRKRCEEAKISCLSLQHDVEVEIRDELISISYSKMKELNRSLFERTIDVVNDTINYSNLNKWDIDKVVLVGGSSNIIYVQELLEREFGYGKLLYQLDKEKVVSIGAAFYADSIKNFSSNSFRIHDIVNHSLGIECITEDGRKNVMKKLINRGCSLPATGSFTFYNGNYASTGDIKIYEGEDDCTLNNTPLKKFVVPLEIKKAGEIEIELFLSVDNDGILTVTAKCNGRSTPVRQEG